VTVLIFWGFGAKRAGSATVNHSCRPTTVGLPFCHSNRNEEAMNGGTILSCTVTAKPCIIPVPVPQSGSLGYRDASQMTQINDSQGIVLFY
jgi:hypothetical protein